MRRQTPNPHDPALRALADLPRDTPALLLHSGRAHQPWASRSLLAAPRAWFRFARGRSQLVGLDRPLTHQPFTDLRGLLNDPALPGRWIGYVGYEVNRLIEPAKLPLPAGKPEDHRGWPAIELAWCPEWTELPPGPADAVGQYPPPPDAFHAGPAQPAVTRDDYLRAVRRVLDYIAAGDVFQVNLTQRFTCPLHAHGSPTPARDLFARLAAVSPAWYGACLELPGGRAICSTSPELFLQLDPSRRVVTRPVKGTLPAHADPATLQRSEKDAAELNMIVDLMRNDLGRVCDYGSVRVTQHRTIETHPTVHHGVATVAGTLHAERDVVSLLRATLPGGSITGAPKVRAMQIIDELEPVARGPYCGAIGYLARDEACLNIAIRTMLLSPAPDLPNATHRVDFSVGGGIVADSDPTAEYDETLAKARAMLAALDTAVAPPKPTA